MPCTLGVQQRLPGGQEALQRGAAGAFQQHLRALHIGHALHRQRDWRKDEHLLQPRQRGGPRCIASGLQEGLGCFLRTRVGAHQGLEGEGRHAGLGAFTELLGRESRVVMAAQRSEQRVIGVPGLHPHLGLAGLVGHVARVAPGAACRLHEQCEQAFGRAEVAGEQRPVGLHRSHQGDPAKVVALGHHLRAHQHVHLAGVNLGELFFQRTFGARGVGVDARHTRGAPCGGDDVAQQRGQLFLQLLSAAPHGGDVEVAAARAGAWHALRETAVVAAQAAVGFVEHLVCAAVRAVAFPAAGVAVQHRGEAAPVQ